MQAQPSRGQDSQDVSVGDESTIASGVKYR